MDKYRLHYLYILLLIIFPISLSGQIKSEKSRIHINNIPEKKPEVSLTLHQPALEESRVFVTPEESFDLAGEVEGFKKGMIVHMNSIPVENMDGNFFWQNKVTMQPGSNSLNIDILQGSQVLERYHYNIYYTAPVTNLADNTLDPGKYYALIIGINSYPAMGENLENAIGDARGVYDVLVDKYTFKQEDITLLLNPEREDLYIAFDKLSKNVKENDNLLIFYAGHGLWEEDTGLGYWLPSDARRENRAAWFPNSSLVDYLKAIKSRHTLLISDACFAGSIFKTRSIFDDVSESIEELYRLPSRKAITSGTLSEVPDESVFIEYLVDRLEKNKDKYLPSESLYSRIRVAVENNSTTVPRTGVIQGVGDEGGDFVFILKKD
ncbi:MAG: caspase family protein [Bacteroidales bacterium]|nr:caspase family protein [Bacteroidales bacterium]